MHRDSEFPAITVHDDDELAQLFGTAVATRRTEHRWPLSRLDDVVLEDGRRYAYKAQLSPTVEAEFYRAAVSPLLLPARDFGRQDETRFLAVEWMTGASLHTAALDDAAFVREATRVVDEIGQIAGKVPVHLDLGTGDALMAEIDTTAARLDGLIAVGRFRLPGATLSLLLGWAHTAADWLDRTPITIAHGDLSPEEVLLT